MSTSIKTAAEAATGTAKEFRDFILRGNVVDLAVGVLIGGAFGAIVTALIDFWKAYQKGLPLEQHRVTGKGDGQTSHIGRFNNTLRQRLARFVRQTLSFSRLDTMHENCLRLFLHECNQLIKSRLEFRLD